MSPAPQCYAEKVVEESATDTDFVWIHDYHLLVLPSLLRKRFNRIRCGVFLHCPFPSSEIFRTFPKREEVLRSLLNAGAQAEAACSAGRCACRWPHKAPLALAAQSTRQSSGHRHVVVSEAMCTCWRAGSRNCKASLPHVISHEVFA